MRLNNNKKKNNKKKKQKKQQKKKKKKTTTKHTHTHKTYFYITTKVMGIFSFSLMNVLLI